MNSNDTKYLGKLIGGGVEASMLLSIEELIDEKEWVEAAKLLRIFLAMYPFQYDLIEKYISASGLYDTCKGVLSDAWVLDCDKNKIITSADMEKISEMVGAEIERQYDYGGNTCQSICYSFLTGYNNALAKKLNVKEVIEDIKEISEEVISIIRQYQRPIRGDNELKTIAAYLCFGDLALGEIVSDFFVGTRGSIDLDRLNVDRLIDCVGAAARDDVEVQKAINHTQEKLDDYLKEKRNKNDRWTRALGEDEVAHMIIKNAILGLIYFHDKDILPGGIVFYLELISMFISKLKRKKPKFGYLIVTANIVYRIRYFLEEVFNYDSNWWVESAIFDGESSQNELANRDLYLTHMSPEVIVAIIQKVLDVLERIKHKSDQSKKLVRFVGKDS